jgi:hypothetical protein
MMLMAGAWIKVIAGASLFHRLFAIRLPQAGCARAQQVFTIPLFWPPPMKSFHSIFIVFIIC